MSVDRRASGTCFSTFGVHVSSLVLESRPGVISKSWSSRTGPQHSQKFYIVKRFGALKIDPKLLNEETVRSQCSKT